MKVLVAAVAIGLILASCGGGASDSTSAPGREDSMTTPRLDETTTTTSDLADTSTSDPAPSEEPPTTAAIDPPINDQFDAVVGALDSLAFDLRCETPSGPAPREPEGTGVEATEGYMFCAVVGENPRTQGVGVAAYESEAEVARVAGPSIDCAAPGAGTTHYVLYHQLLIAIIPGPQFSAGDADALAAELGGEVKVQCP